MEPINIFNQYPVEENSLKIEKEITECEKQLNEIFSNIKANSSIENPQEIIKTVSNLTEKLKLIPKEMGKDVEVIAQNIQMTLAEKILAKNNIKTSISDSFSNWMVENQKILRECDFETLNKLGFVKVQCKLMDSDEKVIYVISNQAIAKSEYLSTALKFREKTEKKDPLEIGVTDEDDFSILAQIFGTLEKVDFFGCPFPLAFLRIADQLESKELFEKAISHLKLNGTKHYYISKTKDLLNRLIIKMDRNSEEQKFLQDFYNEVFLTYLSTWCPRNGQRFLSEATEEYGSHTKIDLKKHLGFFSDLETNKNLNATELLAKRQVENFDFDKEYKDSVHARGGYNGLTDFAKLRILFPKKWENLSLESIRDAIFSLASYLANYSSKESNQELELLVDLLAIKISNLSEEEMLNKVYDDITNISKSKYAYEVKLIKSLIEVFEKNNILPDYGKLNIALLRAARKALFKDNFETVREALSLIKVDAANNDKEELLRELKDIIYNFSVLSGLSIKNSNEIERLLQQAIDLQQKLRESLSMS